MSELKEIFTLSVDLTKIDKSKIKEVTRKDGTKALFIDLTLYVNSEADQYSNIGSVSINQSKEEREAKAPKVYVGNAKRQWASSSVSASEVSSLNVKSEPNEMDILPF